MTLSNLARLGKRGNRMHPSPTSSWRFFIPPSHKKPFLTTTRNEHMTSTPPSITATTPPTDEAPQQQQQQQPPLPSPQTQQHEPPPPERPSLYGRGTFRDRASRRGADLLLAGSHESDPNNNNKLLPSRLLGISQAALFASKLSAARLAIGNKKKLSSERFKNNVHHRNVGGYTVRCVHQLFNTFVD
jgi:hypothetical protein